MLSAFLTLSLCCSTPNLSTYQSIYQSNSLQHDVEMMVVGVGVSDGGGSGGWCSW